MQEVEKSRSREKSRDRQKHTDPGMEEWEQTGNRDREKHQEPQRHPETKR